MKDLIPDKVATATIKHFFDLYKNKNLPKKVDHKTEQEQPGLGEISIRAFSYNYSKFKKAETEITNIMSEKYAKIRYEELKKYLADFLGYYP